MPCADQVPCKSTHSRMLWPVVGCPDRRIDRLCITCCSPSQPSHHAHSIRSGHALLRHPTRADRIGPLPTGRAEAPQLFGRAEMKLPHRRRFLRLAAGAAALQTLPHIARAQAYPSRPVTIVVFVPAGGSPDMSARLVAQSLSRRLGQSFVVENRPGAGGNLALQAVARAPADGYTLALLATP